MKAATIIFWIGIVVSCVLGLYWLFWKLWCWVVPQLFTSISPNIAHPSYWLFVGALLILGFIGNAIFGNKTSSKE